MPEGYSIPFKDPETGLPMSARDGKPFVRVRLQIPMTLGTSVAKYLSPANSGNRVFIPAAAHDSAMRGEPLVVTEGEKKALCASINGIPTMGLVGVWGFQDSQTKDLISDLKPYIGIGKDVTLVLDSDAGINHDIAQVAHRFSNCVKLRGGQLRICVLPPSVQVPVGNGVNKSGLDDLIVSGGLAKATALIAAAKPFDGSVEDIYIAWVGAFCRACREAGVAPQSIVDDILRKGFWDGVTSATRRRIRDDVGGIWPELVTALGLSIRARLAAECVNVPAPEHAGQNLANNRSVRAPGFNSPLKVDSLEGDVVWCFPAGSQFASRPVLRNHLQVAVLDPAAAANGADGGRPRAPSVTDMTNAFLSQNEYSLDGICLLRYLRGQWYCYKAGYYQRIQEQDVKSAVMSFLRRHPDYSIYATTKTQTDCINQIKASDAAGLLSTTEIPAWLDVDGPKSAAGWIAAKNGIVNVANMAAAISGGQVTESDIFRPHTPQLFTPHGLTYDFDPKAQAPLFEQYLTDVQPDPKSREVIQMMLGLCLVQDVRYNVFFMFVGKGGEGKSVLLHILVKLVGEHNVCHVPFAKFCDKFSVGLLTEYPVNVIGDGDTDLPKDVGLGRVEGVLKDVCDGGLLPVEHKFQEPGHARATARCIAAANSLPGFYDRSEAIWDRMRVIPFDVRIRGTAKEDPRLRDKIVETELPGIFNFAVAGLAKLKGLQRFPETSAGASKKTEHRARCDHELEFLQDGYMEDPEALPIATQVVFSHYKGWMKERNYYALGEGKFADSIMRVFPNARRDRSRGADGTQFRAWFGVRKVGAAA